MRFKLPIFVVASGLLLASNAHLSYAQQVQPNGQPIQVFEQQTQPVNGSQLMNQAVEQLAKEGRLFAKIRQQVKLYGQELVGTGTYWQLKEDDSLLRRMEIKLPVGGRLTSVTQVFDGRHLWLHRDFAGQKSLSRVDVRRVSEAMQAGQGSAYSQSENWFMLGGLPNLLNELASNFEFAAARQVTYAETPAWQLRGQWKQARLDKLLGCENASSADLPSHVPQSVQVILSGDQQMPLFPFRIDFQRKGEAEKQESLLALDFFELQRPAQVDAQMFQYRVGDLTPADHTDLYISSLRPGKPAK